MEGVSKVPQKRKFLQCERGFYLKTDVIAPSTALECAGMLNKQKSLLSA